MQEPALALTSSPPHSCPPVGYRPTWNSGPTAPSLLSPLLASPSFRPGSPPTAKPTSCLTGHQACSALLFPDSMVLSGLQIPALCFLPWTVLLASFHLEEPGHLSALPGSSLEPGGSLRPSQLLATLSLCLHFSVTAGSSPRAGLRLTCSRTPTLSTTGPWAWKLHKRFSYSQLRSRVADTSQHPPGHRCTLRPRRQLGTSILLISTFGACLVPFLLSSLSPPTLPNSPTPQISCSSQWADTMCEAPFRKGAVIYSSAIRTSLPRS